MTTPNKIPPNWPDALKMADKIEAIVRLALRSDDEDFRTQCFVQMSFLIGSEDYDA